MLSACKNHIQRLYYNLIIEKKLAKNEKNASLKKRVELQQEQNHPFNQNSLKTKQWQERLDSHIV